VKAAPPGKSVEISVTIAAKNHAMGLQVLHRKTKGIKLNGTKIATGKLANREQITD
jgi:hypothetical protein